MSSFVNLLDIIYPIGSIYYAYGTATSPASTVGGTWSRIENKFLWFTETDSNIGKTGGEMAHTLTINEMPSHNHSSNGTWIVHDAGSWATRGSTNQGSYNTPFASTPLEWSYAGGAEPQQYATVCRMRCVAPYCLTSVAVM